MVDTAIKDFVANIALQNEKSARTVNYFLQDFESFVSEHLGTKPAVVIKKLKAGKLTQDPKEEQVYRVLGQYASWLKAKRLDTEENGARVVKLKLYWARALMESNFIPISKVLFKKLVRSPTPEEPDVSPVSKDTVTRVITSLDNPRLQTVSLWYASMGWRASESLALRNLNFEGLNLKTLKFDTLPAFVNTSGKFAKTRRGKRRRLTMEMSRQIESYLAWKYRKQKRRNRQPTPKPEDRIFLPLWRKNTNKETGEVKLENAYTRTAESFRKTIDRLGIGWEESGKRRKVTLHTLRRFCFTQCKRVVDEPYAKYHIGRKIHEYDKMTQEELDEVFESVEPYLTFTDTRAVEEKQRSIVAEQKQLREELKKRDVVMSNILGGMKQFIPDDGKPREIVFDPKTGKMEVREPKNS